MSDKDRSHVGNQLSEHTAIGIWLSRLQPAERRAAERELSGDAELYAELARMLRDAGEFDLWLAELATTERAAVTVALARNPDLREEVGVLIRGMEPELREAFLRGFQRALLGTPGTSPVLDGLEEVVVSLRKNRRRGGGDRA